MHLEKGDNTMYRIYGPTTLKGQRLLVLIAILAGLLTVPGVARADEIALWNFNDMNVIVDRGAGTLTTTANPANVGFSSGLSLQAQMGDPAGSSLAIQNARNNGSILELHVSTVGFDSIGFRVAFQRNATGFNLLTAQYSIDGINFNPLVSTNGIPDEPAEGFVLVFFNSPSVLDNQPLFTIRMIVDGASSDTGLIRLDNILISGTPTAVPEPATLLLMGTGLFGAVAARRRRRIPPCK